jgi:NAD+ kinase
MKVGLVVHSGRNDATVTAHDLADRLSSAGATVVASAGPADARTVEVGAQIVRGEDFSHGLDLAISVGGDGTLLRAAHLCRDAGVPVLGLNLGRMGFLTEVEREDVDAVVERVLAGGFEVEERPTLTVRAESGEGVREDWALNEVSVEKTARQRVLQMRLHVSGTFFAPIPADAIVVASPTGSTAYAFSAGGPILSPSVRGMIVTPVAPHSVFSRSIVVAEDEEIRIEVLADQEQAVESCDGRPPFTVAPGGSVYVRGDGPPVRLARIRPRDLYGRVRAKFGLR